jgi:DNA-binding IclR family transcriptional regulator
VTNGTLRWLAKAQGSNSNLIVDSASGVEAVPHATASGKAWLSTLPTDELERLVTTNGLTAQTDRTTTDIGVLLAELERVRNTGYATVSEEMDVGISAIAAPIVPSESQDSRAVGTVSVAGPSARLTQDVLEEFAPALRDTASELASTWRVYAHFDNVSPSRA